MWMAHFTSFRIKSVDMYFTRYLGKDENNLNGFIMQPGRVYLFSHGSTVKTPLGSALYYSDLIMMFSEEIRTTKLSFNADIPEFQIPQWGNRTCMISIFLKVQENLSELWVPVGQVKLP